MKNCVKVVGNITITSKAKIDIFGGEKLCINGPFASRYWKTFQKCWGKQCPLRWCFLRTLKITLFWDFDCVILQQRLVESKRLWLYTCTKLTKNSFMNSASFLCCFYTSVFKGMIMKVRQIHIIFDTFMNSLKKYNFQKMYLMMIPCANEILDDW